VSRYPVHRKVTRALNSRYYCFKVVGWPNCDVETGSLVMQHTHQYLPTDTLFGLNEESPCSTLGI